MEKPKHHMLLCASFRVGGEPKGYCHKKGSTGLLQYIEEEVLDRGMDVLLSTTGCLKQCETGPVVVISPDNIWYGGVENESAVDEILDALENGGTAEGLLL